MTSEKRMTADSDAEQLNIFYQAAGRVHKLAAALLDDQDPDAPRPAGASRDAQDHSGPAASQLAERFGAGMIAAVGGRPMVELLGHWVSRARRARN